MKKIKCKTETRYFLDPDQVFQRLDEMYDLILSRSSPLTEVKVANVIGYFRAHIERDTEEHQVAVEEEE